MILLEPHRHKQSADFLVRICLLGRLHKGGLGRLGQLDADLVVRQVGEYLDQELGLESDSHRLSDIVAAYGFLCTHREVQILGGNLQLSVCYLEYNLAGRLVCTDGNTSGGVENVCP